MVQVPISNEDFMESVVAVVVRREGKYVLLVPHHPHPSGQVLYVPGRLWLVDESRQTVLGPVLGISYGVEEFGPADSDLGEQAFCDTAKVLVSLGSQPGHGLGEVEVRSVGADEDRGLSSWLTVGGILGDNGRD